MSNFLATRELFAGGIKMPPTGNIGPWELRLGPKLRRSAIVTVSVVLALAGVQILVSILAALGIVG